MHALTISQPYASLIARGEKFVENRTWGTRHRGLLAIHAGSGRQYLTAEELQGYATGCVIAVADVVTVVALSQAREAWEHPERFEDGVPKAMREDGLGRDALEELITHPHAEGPVCWFLRNVRRLETAIVIGGKQNLWQLPEWIADRIRLEIDR